MRESSHGEYTSLEGMRGSPEGCIFQFSFVPPLFSPTHHFREVKFLCVCGGRGYCTFITILVM